jgi:hypothetical protein
VVLGDVEVVVVVVEVELDVVERAHTGTSWEQRCDAVLGSWDDARTP